jgi:hypothetical protein
MGVRPRRNKARVGPLFEAGAPSIARESAQRPAQEHQGAGVQGGDFAAEAEPATLRGGFHAQHVRARRYQGFGRRPGQASGDGVEIAAPTGVGPGARFDRRAGRPGGLSFEGCVDLGAGARGGRHGLILRVRRKIISGNITAYRYLYSYYD